MTPNRQGGSTTRSAATRSGGTCSRGCSMARACRLGSGCRGPDRWGARTLLGLIAGYAGGAADAVIMRLGDMQLAFPFILLAIMFLVVLGPGL